MERERETSSSEETSCRDVVIISPMKRERGETKFCREANKDSQDVIIFSSKRGEREEERNK